MHVSLFGIFKKKNRKVSMHLDFSFISISYHVVLNTSRVFKDIRI